MSQYRQIVLNNTVKKYSKKLKGIIHEGEEIPVVDTDLDLLLDELSQLEARIKELEEENEKLKDEIFELNENATEKAYDKLYVEVSHQEIANKDLLEKLQKAEKVVEELRLYMYGMYFGSPTESIYQDGYNQAIQDISDKLNKLEEEDETN